MHALWFLIWGANFLRKMLFKYRSLKKQRKQRGVCGSYQRVVRLRPLCDLAGLLHALLPLLLHGARAVQEGVVVAAVVVLVLPVLLPTLAGHCVFQCGGGAVGRGGEANERKDEFSSKLKSRSLTLAYPYFYFSRCF